MIIDKKHALFILVLIVHMLVVSGINGEDIGLPSFITSNKLSYLLSFVILLWVSKDGLALKGLTKLFLYSLLVFILLKYATTLTSIVMLNNQNVSLSRLYIWFMPLIFFQIGYSLVLKNFSFNFAYWIVSVFVIINFLLIFEIFYKSFFQGVRMYDIRVFMDSISVGQTRYLNGLFLLVALVYSLTDGTLLKKTISYTFIIILILLSLLSGSRQTILAMLLFFTILNFRKIKWIPLISFSAIIVFIATFNSYVNEQILNRFVDKTSTQVSEGYSRITVYSDSVSSFIQNLMFGIGGDGFPSYHLNTTGLTTHNDYLTIGVEHGIITLLLYFFMIYIIAKVMRLCVQIDNDNNYEHFVKYSIAMICTYILIISNFNSLTNEPLIYIILGILFRYSDNLTKVDST